MSIMVVAVDHGGDGRLADAAHLGEGARAVLVIITRVEDDEAKGRLNDRVTGEADAHDAVNA